MNPYMEICGLCLESMFNKLRALVDSIMNPYINAKMLLSS
jgi:hypothetical protein